MGGLGAIGVPGLIIILVIVLIVFGPKKTTGNWRCCW